MLTIRTGNDFFDIDPKATLQLVFNSPMFTFEVFQGDYTLPVTLPPTQKNKRLLGYSDLLNIAEVTAEYANISIYFKGNRLITGTLHLLKISELGFDCNIVYGVSAISSASKKLWELPLGGDRSMGSTTADIITYILANQLLVYPDSDFTFPMHYNPSFYGEKNEDFSGWINYSLAHSADPAFTPINYIEGAKAWNKWAICPWPNLCYVLKQGFMDAGFKAQGAFLDDKDFQNLLIYNNVVLDKKPATDVYGCKVALGSIQDGDSTGPALIELFDEDAPDYYDNGNHFNTTTHKYTFAEQGHYYFHAEVTFNIDTATSMSPIPGQAKLYIDGFLEHTVSLSVMDDSTYILIFDYDRVISLSEVGLEAELKFDVFPNDEFGTQTWHLYAETFLQVSNPTYSDLNLWDTTINLQNHVPDITFGEFLQAIRQAFNLVYLFDETNKTVNIELVDDIIKLDPANITLKGSGPVSKTTGTDKIRSINWTFGSDDELVEDNFTTFPEDRFLGNESDFGGLPAPVAADQYVYTLGEVKIWRTRYNEDNILEWVEHADAYYDHIFDDTGTVELKPAVSPLFNRFDGSIQAGIITPYIKQVGSSNFFGIGKNEFSFRIAFNKMFNASVNGTFYPHASASIYGVQSQAGYDVDGVYGSQTRSLVFDNWSHPGELTPLWTLFVRIYNRGISYTHNIRYNIIDLLTYNVNKPFMRLWQKFITKKTTIKIGNNIEIAESETIKA